MYVGWADGRGMRVRRNGGDEGAVVLEVAGLGAYTLLKPEIGLHVLELPHEDDRSFDRVTVLVDVEPVGLGGNGPQSSDRREPAIVRRYRHDPSPLVRDASGMRTGQDRPRAGRRLRPARGRTARLAHSGAGQRLGVQQARRVGDVARRRRLHVHVDAEVEVVHARPLSTTAGPWPSSTCPSSAGEAGHHRRRTPRTARPSSPSWPSIRCIP